MAVVCPCCTGVQVKRYPMLYEEGTASIVGNVGFGGLSRGGLFGGGGSLTGTQQSLAALKVAPPEKRMIIPVRNPLGKFVIGFLVFSWLISNQLLLQVFALGLIAWRLFTVYQWNREQWPKLLGDWQQKWYCSQCGTTFNP